jgi:hypothetical protein
MKNRTAGCEAVVSVQIVFDSTHLLSETQSVSDFPLPRVLEQLYFYTAFLNGTQVIGLSRRKKEMD